ncbi:hypothetical protein BN1723_008939, partial [Verticillium longisporum]
MSGILGYLYKFFVGYFALTVALYMLSIVVPKAAFGARVLAAYVCLIAAALYGALAAILLRLIGNPGSSQWATARFFKWIMLVATGVIFEIEDPKNILETTRPAVFIGNHQTELDVLMLAMPAVMDTTKTLKATGVNTSS